MALKRCRRNVETSDIVRTPFPQLVVPSKWTDVEPTIRLTGLPNSVRVRGSGASAKVSSPKPRALGSSQFSRCSARRPLTTEPSPGEGFSRRYGKGCQKVPPHEQGGSWWRTRRAASTWTHDLHLRESGHVGNQIDHPPPWAKKRQNRTEGSNDSPPASESAFPILSLSPHPKRANWRHFRLFLAETELRRIRAKAGTPPRWPIFSEGWLRGPVL